MQDINVRVLGTILAEMTASLPSPLEMLRIDHPTHQDQGIHVFQHSLGERGAWEWRRGDLGAYRNQFFNPRKISCTIKCSF